MKGSIQAVKWDGRMANTRCLTGAHIGLPFRTVNTLPSLSAMSHGGHRMRGLRTFLLCQAGDNAHQRLVPPARQP